jgi:hypothetical protein
LREAVAELDQGTGEAIGERGEEQREAEEGEKDEGGDAAELIGADDPASSDGGEAGYEREGEGHAGEKGKAGFEEGAVRTGEDERQDREDAGAEYGENAAQVGEKKQEH